MLKRNYVVWALILTAFIFNACASKPSQTIEQASVDYELLLTVPGKNISYDYKIRPILEKRCVVCHGCFDAPCQLKLSSHEGILRGASEVKVYDGARIKAIPPSRLGIDAKSISEWRQKGFHPVLNENEKQDANDNLQESVMYQMLRLKQRNPQPRVGMLSDDIDLSLDRNQVCTTKENFSEFAQKHPMWGMPYAMPNLTNDEYGTLVQWLAQGAPGPKSAEPSAEAIKQIKRWEAFLNGSDPKKKLVSRYLYEHLMQAHIHLRKTSNSEFYELVRSTTPPGQPIDIIATVRPFDDPGPKLYYRLQRYQPSIVVKTHNVYEWSEQRLQRYIELFIKPNYSVTQLPGYDIETTANPFKVFEAIPPVARYQFLLDDARFFIEGFIKGPVCRGQIALNVIEDQFWVFFANPNPQALTLQPEFLKTAEAYLNLPAERGDDSLRILSTWYDYLNRQHDYMATIDIFLMKKFQGKDAELNIDDAMKYLWNGAYTNRSAALTVFRHFDSATVSYGLLGDYPDTSWVIDYPLLERIHYLLVAGYNVYGNVTHQLTTRLYMDFLRMEAENHFLLFMPVSQRETIRNRWYQGMQAKIEKEFKESQQVVMSLDTVAGYKTDDPQREFYQNVQNYLGKGIAPPDSLNRCNSGGCENKNNPTQVKVDQAMSRIAKARGEITKVFPDVAFLRVRTGARSDAGLAYTIILNKGYSNITSMFESEDRRDLSQDTLTVVHGLVGSYPNFFFDVESKDIEAFVSRFEAIRSRDDYEQFVALYGIRRTDLRFWSISDWFYAKLAQDDPLHAGIFDLNRYRNR